MFLSIVIPTYNRVDDLKRCIESVFKQVRLPDEVIVVDGGDDILINHVNELFPSIRLIKSKRGLTVQRNTGIDNLSADSDVVLFLDDDIVLEESFTDRIIECYEKDKNLKIGGVDGFPIIDGKYTHEVVESPVYQKVQSLYGCNMSYRVKSIEGLRFDENLGFYAWLEDLDFSLRVGLRYELVRVNNAFCNHYASPRSRVAERKYGFMQMSNWFYLSTKVKLPTSVTISSVLYPLKNLVRVYNPVYKERLVGNLKAIKSILINYKNPKLTLSEKL